VSEGAEVFEEDHRSSSEPQAGDALPRDRISKLSRRHSEQSLSGCVGHDGRGDRRRVASWKSHRAQDIGLRRGSLSADEACVQLHAC
jgi:hypothetical protein